MKKIWVLFFSLFLAAGCATMQQMNDNMVRANEMMAENTQTMTTAKETIANNTEVVKKATVSTKQFELFLTVLMAILLIPSVILYRLYRKLAKTNNLRK